MPIKGKNKKRSPLKQECLRYAGQSLEARMYDAIYDKILAPVLVVFFLCSLALLEWTRVFLNTPNLQWFYTAIAMIFATYYGIKIMKNIKEIKNIRLGRDGERIVGESLDELKTIGYKVYHDIVSDSFNIDHVVIGPAGVFTIETKTYRKQVGTNPQIYYDGNKIRIDGVSAQSQIKDPVRQAKGQMYWLQDFINDNAKVKIKVQPVVIFPGWFIHNSGSNAEVLVLNEKAFPGLLKKVGRVLDETQINLIATHLESYNRNN